MTNRERNLIYLLAGIAFGIMLFLVILPAQATGKNTTIINNYYETPQEPDTIINQNMTITEGISKEDLARGLATVGAAQQHYDYSTQQLQLGLGWAYYEGETALSLGIAKRWGEDSWVPNVLFYGSVSTTGDSRSLYAVGFTVRL